MTETPEQTDPPAKKPDPTDDIKRHGGALGGAVLGGIIGSVVPGIGTVIGAAVGGVVGHFHDSHRHSAKKM